MTDRGAAELAVVIVNYNTGDYLERCLASLETHRGDIGIDVLVIDNASHDGSHTRAVAAHPWARLIENPTNVYLSPAWNQGIRATEAPYVLLLNPDTEWWAGTLADYVAVARAPSRGRHRGPDGAQPDGTDVRERPAASRASSTPSATRSWGRSCPTTASRAATTWRAGTGRPSARWTGCPGAACWCRARPSRTSGMLDEAFPLYGEELDLATRLRDAGLVRRSSRPSVEVVHEIGVSTGRSRRMLLMHSHSIYRYYRKHRAGGMAAPDAAARVGRAPRCAPSSSGCGGGVADEGRGAGRRRGHAPAPAHRDDAQAARCPLMDRPFAGPRARPPGPPRRARGGAVLARTWRRRSIRSSSRGDGDPRSPGSPRPSRSAPAARSCNALDHLVDDEPFFALNGDILTDLDLTAMLAFHASAAPPSRSPCTTWRMRGRSAWSPPSPTGGCWSSGRSRRIRSPATSTPAPTCSTRRCSRPWTRRRGVVDRARHLPGGDRGGPSGVRVPRRTPTGSTWGRRRSTCRRTSTCSRARCTTCRTRRRGSPTADVDIRAHLGRWVAVGRGPPSAPRRRSTIR